MEIGKEIIIAIVSSVVAAIIVAIFFGHFCWLDNSCQSPPTPDPPQLILKPFSIEKGLISRLNMMLGPGVKECGGFRQVDCNFGYVVGTVSNVGNGKAINCKIIGNMYDHNTSDILRVGTPVDTIMPIEEKLQQSDIYEHSEQKFKIQIQFPNSGDYSVISSVKCINGFSEESKTGLQHIQLE